jgi:hypothetical protein
VAAVTATILFAYPKILLDRTVLYIYLWVVIYYIGIQTIWKDRVLSESLISFNQYAFSYIAPVFLAVIINVYIQKKNESTRIGKLYFYLLILLFITSLQYSMMAVINPALARGGGQLDVSERGITTLVSYGYFYGISLIFMLFAYYVKFRRSAFSKNSTKYFYLIITITIFISLKQSQYVTAVLAAAFSFIMAYYTANNLKKAILTSTLVVIFFSFFPTTIIEDIFYALGSLLQEGYLRDQVIDFGRTLALGDFNPNTGVTYASTIRFVKIPPLLESIASNPLIGGGANDGHNFWLDNLSMFGILGMLPWFLIIRQQMKFNLQRMSEDFKPYYIISILIFVLVGIFKGGIVGWQPTLLVFFVGPAMNYLQFYFKRKST